MAQESNGDAQRASESELYFGPFRLEAAKRLWQGHQLIDIRPRPLALLRYLAERPGRLVTREELLKRLWPGIYVSSTVVKVCVREIRHALKDEATQPQFIETVRVHGYRFIAPLATTAPPVISHQLSVVSSAKEGTKPPQLGTENWQLATRPQQLITDHWQLTTHFVGREHELAQLQDWYERVQQGEPHLIFISGEAGIGKTALVARFLTQVQAREAVLIGRGYCVEQAGHGEAYLPVLQAWQQMCRAPDGDAVVAGLRRYAPLWLVQLAGVIEAEEQDALQRQLQGSSSQRMLREFGEAIERLAAGNLVILVFEDLHWSDGATLELLAYLAQRREPARLLVLGTYRLTETVMNTHPLRRVVQRMLGRGQCQELALELLTEAEVETYLTQRLGASPVVAALWPVIHRCTDGHALFVTHFVDYLVQQGLLVEVGDRWELRVEPASLEDLIPDHVQRLIARQIEELSKERQQLLEVASVVGMTFTASEVAAVVNRTVEDVEAVYDDLANQEQLIDVQGLAEWPPGVITVRYGFRHTLHQQVLYNRIGLARRARWHRQIGEHFAAVYGERAPEVAGELAVHFMQGHDYGRAVFYRQQAGEQALQQSTYQKALGHARAGLALLTHLPATAERRQLELKLRQLVSTGLVATRGYGDNELEENLHHAQQLCQGVEDEAALVPIVVGLARVQLIRANRATMERLVEQESRLTEQVREAQLLVQLHTQLATTETFRGRHARAAEHYQQVRAHYDPHARHLLLYSFAGDPLVTALNTSGVSLSLMGWLEQGWSRVAQGLMHARELVQGLTLTQGQLQAVMVKHLRGEYDEAGQYTQKMVARAREYELPLLMKLGIILQGGMAVQRGALAEGIATITTGLAQYRATGAQFLVPYFLSFLAEGYRHQGKVAEALQVVHEALSLTATNFDVFWEAELQRLKGELFLQSRQVEDKSKAGPGQVRGKSGVSPRQVQAGPRQVKTSPKSQVEKEKSRVGNAHHGVTVAEAGTVGAAHPTGEEEAAACFLSAIEIARKQQAKSLELRAVMSLARLWRQQGKPAAARQLLAEIYGWFTEGFDTADLQEAKALLASLT